MKKLLLPVIWIIVLAVLALPVAAIANYDYYIDANIENTDAASVWRTYRIPLNAAGLIDSGFMQDDADDIRVIGPSGEINCMIGNLTSNNTWLSTAGFTIPAESSSLVTVWMGNETATRDQRWMASPLDDVYIPDDPDMDITDELTIKADFTASYCPGVGSYHWLVHKNNAYGLGIGNGTRIIGTVATGSGGQIVSAPLTLDRWYANTTATYDGEDLKLWVDGYGNYLSNGNFEHGDPSTNWTADAGANPVRSAAKQVIGAYSTSITRAGVNCRTTQTIPNFADFKGETVTFGCWVWSDTVMQAAIGISEFAGFADVAWHSGSSSWEWVENTLTIDTSATQLKATLDVYNTNGTAYFDGAMFVLGDTITPTAYPLSFKYCPGVIAVTATDVDLAAFRGELDHVSIGDVDIDNPNWETILDFEPEDIGATTIDSDSGGNDATYTLAANPATVTLTLGGLQLAEVAAADYDPADDTTGLVSTPPDQPSGFYGSGSDWSGGVPGSSIFAAIAGDEGSADEIPASFFFYLIFAIILTGAGLFMYRKSNGSMVSVSVLVGGVLALLIAMYAPLGWWLLGIYIIASIGFITLENRYGF